MKDHELLQELDNLTIPITRLLIALSERLGRWVSYSELIDIKKELEQ